MSFILIVKIGLLIFALISALIYGARRLQDKERFKSLLSTPVDRMLTPEEVEALQPFVTKSMGKKVPPLISEGVRTLTGEFLQHGLSVNHNGSSSSKMHNTIGGVDVLLPYDAIDHVKSSNSAEVVMTADYAIIIKLNGTFDLISALRRTLAPATQGTTVTQSDNSRFEEQHDNSKPWMKVVSQRDESAVEIAARSIGRAGWGGGAILLGLGILAFGSQSLIVGGLGLTLIAFGFWYAFFYKKLTSPKQVSRIKGTLMQVTHTAASSTDGASSSVTSIGGQQVINIPNHWLPYITFGEVADVDVVLEEQSWPIVRYGSALSLEKEEALFPSVYWGRYVWFAAIAAISLFFVWVVNDDLAGDFSHSRALITNETNVLINPKTASAGDFISLKGSVYCDLVDHDGKGLSCDYLRLDNASFHLTEGDIDPILKDFYTGKALASGSGSLAAIIDGVNNRAGTLERSYGISDKAYVNMAELVNNINSFCTNANKKTKAQCEVLQNKIVRSFQENNHPGITWTQIQAQAAAGDLGVTSLDFLTKVSWEVGLNDLAEVLIHQLIDAKVAKMKINQPAGTVYALPENWHKDRKGLNATSTYATLFLANPIKSMDRFTYLATTKLPSMNVDISGMVTKVTKKNTHGDIILHIDPDRNIANLRPAVQHVAVILIAGGLLIVSIFLLIVRGVAANKRYKALIAHLEAHSGL